MKALREAGVDVLVSLLTADEIRQAFADYQRTQFGGWPWKHTDPVHGPTGARFARFIDGHTERPA